MREAVRGFDVLMVEAQLRAFVEAGGDMMAFDPCGKHGLVRDELKTACRPHECAYLQLAVWMAGMGRCEKPAASAAHKEGASFQGFACVPPSHAAPPPTAGCAAHTLQELTRRMAACFGLKHSVQGSGNKRRAVVVSGAATQLPDGLPAQHTLDALLGEELQRQRAGAAGGEGVGPAGMAAARSTPLLRRQGREHGSGGSSGPRSGTWGRAQPAGTLSSPIAFVSSGVIDPAASPMELVAAPAPCTTPGEAAPAAARQQQQQQQQHSSPSSSAAAAAAAGQQAAASLHSAVSDPAAAATQRAAAAAVAATTASFVQGLLLDSDDPGSEEGAAPAGGAGTSQPHASSAVAPAQQCAVYDEDCHSPASDEDVPSRGLGYGSPAGTLLEVFEDRGRGVQRQEPFQQHELPLYEALNQGLGVTAGTGLGFPAEGSALGHTLPPPPPARSLAEAAAAAGSTATRPSGGARKGALRGTSLLVQPAGSPMLLCSKQQAKAAARKAAKEERRRQRRAGGGCGREGEEAAPMAAASATASGGGSSYADFERYTTGIGSRLLASQGWVAGSGLGRAAQGRAEPLMVQRRPKQLGLGAN